MATDLVVQRPMTRPPPSLVRRLRLLVFPRGSVRERVAFLAKVSVLEVRRGPRGWWAAVRNAGRLLVPRWPRPPVPSRFHLPAAAAAGGEQRFAGEEPGLVSIVLPVYNQAALLGDAIASVLAQTHAQLELIVLSDGSTDGVEKVFDRFARDPRVRFLVQPNQKLPKALSNGFDFARGEFWTWTSADNLMEPRHVERLVAFLRAHPDVDFVFADYYAIDDRGAMLRDPAFRPHNRHPPTSPEIHLPRDLSGYNDAADNFIGPCFLYRGLTGKVMGDYAPELGVEDYDYWLRLNTIGRVSHLGTDELLYRYRVHDNSLCAQAVELGIHPRKERLLALDRRRRSALARGWRVAIDPRLTDLAPAGPGADAASEAGGAAAGRPAGDGRDGNGRTVAVVPPLALAAGRGAGGAAHTIAWFDGRDPEAPYRHRLSIAAAADACLAADPITADRLALFTDRAFVARSPAQAVAMAELHAKSTFLREFDQDVQQRQRTPPRVRLRGDRALRVLLQVDDFAQGGLEQVVLDLARTLREGGARVRLVITGAAGDAAGRADALGIAVVQLDRARPDAHYRDLLRAGVDVVNAHYSTFGAGIAAALGIPFVQTVHNTYVWMDAPAIDALRRTVPVTAAFVCVSAEAARYADLVLGVPPAKLIVLENGVEVAPAPALSPGERAQARAQLGLQPEDFAFLQVASIYPPKAQRVAVHALHGVRPQHPRARLLLAGRTLDADYHALLLGDIGRLGLRGAVTELGHRDDVPRLLRVADAFLLPSYWEGWSLAVAEAAIAGLPLVLSDVGGAREQVAIAGGRLVPPPFDSITCVRRDTLGALVHAVQPEFVAALAGAMGDACAGRVPRPHADACRSAFDRRLALAQHVRLFAWLAGGGALASARAWLRHRVPIAVA